MSKGESRTVSATGGVKAGNLQRGSLIPPNFLMELAEHYGRGALKYDDNNWARGYEWSKSYDAILRHLTAFWGGEDYDVCHCPTPASELPCKACGATGAKHITAVAWHSAALSHFMDKFPEYDDRHKWSDKQPETPKPVVLDAQNTIEELTFSDRDTTWATDSYYGTRLWKYIDFGWKTQIVREDCPADRMLSDEFFDTWKPGGYGSGSGHYASDVPAHEGPFRVWNE